MKGLVMSRRLVLLVGPESATRDELASRLIDRGHSAIVCEGPPGCVLLQHDRCALTDVADVAVIMPNPSERRVVSTALTRCAAAARSTVIVAPTVVRNAPPRAEIADSSHSDFVIETVNDAMLHDERRARRKGVADVADNWL